MPRHRGVLYTVVRVSVMQDSNFVYSPVLIGCYVTMQRAEEIKGKSEQEFKDHKIEGFDFSVVPVTFYDE